MNRIFNTYPVDDGYWQDLSGAAEALQYLEEDGRLYVGAVFHTGIERTPIPSNFITDTDQILEWYDEHICENTGEWSCGNTGSDHVPQQAKDELNTFLKQWADKYLKVSFFEVDHVEAITVTQEMIDAYHANTEIPLPEFKYKEPSHQSVLDRIQVKIQTMLDQDEKPHLLMVNREIYAQLLKEVQPSELVKKSNHTWVNGLLIYLQDSIELEVLTYDQMLELTKSIQNF